MPVAHRLLHFSISSLLVCGPGCASTSVPPAGEPIPWSGEVRVDGALRAMFHEGEIGPAVSLDSITPGEDVYALGAIAELAGEITILRGEIFLSYPRGEETRTERATTSDVGAALLVSTRVPAWQRTVVEEPIAFSDLDEAIGELAAAAGLSLDGRFPFLLEGEFEELEWHVIDGSRLRDGGTSHHDHLAASVRGTLERATSTLVGFYSSRDQGVFTHRGSKTHLHCVLSDPPLSGHVDHVVVPAGVTVSFPIRETGTSS